MTGTDVESHDGEGPMSALSRFGVAVSRAGARLVDDAGI